MFRIRRGGFIITMVAVLLVLSIFSAPKIETSALTGAATAITGMQTSSNCPSFPVDRILELRGEIEDRLYLLRLLGVPAWPTFMEIPAEGEVKDAAYIRELRGYLMEMTRYFWNLERVDPAPNMISGIHTTNYAESDAPASYDAIPEELFQQAFGKDTWTNQYPECITEVDLDELRNAILNLKWIFVPLPNIRESDFYWTRLHPPFVKVEWSNIKTTPKSGDYTLSGSWAKTLTEFGSADSYYNYNIDNCWVYDEGIGSWNNERMWRCGRELRDWCYEGFIDWYTTERKFARCKVKFDFSSFPVEIEDAKAFFYMSYRTDAELSELVGNINLGPIARGYNLIDVEIPEDGILNIVVESTLSDVKPNVAKDGRSYGKGFEGYLAGVFISPYAENNPPVVEVKLKANEQSAPSISSTTEFNVCDNLECNIEVSDTDKKDTIFSIEYTIDGGHGTLAKTQPEISGKTDCYGNPCAKQLIIPKEYTNYKDKIYCKARAFDGYEWSEMDSAYATIAGRCSQ